MKRFECLWYSNAECKEDPITKEFSTKQAAINFYEKHKNDTDKFHWWVTKRNVDWEVVTDYVCDIELYKGGKAE